MSYEGPQGVVAEFVAGLDYNDVPELARNRSRDAIRDCISVMVAGSEEPSSSAVARLLGVDDGAASSGDRLLVGRMQYGKPTEAALYNGVLAHALDFDDVTHPANAHFSAVLVPAIMAALPGIHPLSSQFITAYVTGYEVGSKLGALIPRGLRRGRWHPTGVFGTIAAAAGVAKALQLDGDGTSLALGIATSCCSGLLVNLGSMTKPLHAGRAAQGGVTAAILASTGFTSSRDAFGDDGFFATYASTEVQESRDAIAQKFGTLGQEWELCEDEGLAIKPFPSCAATHPAIEATLLARAKIGNGEIDAVHVGTSSAAPKALVHHRPMFGLQGKFSMEFCVAAALLYGRITIDTFQDEVVRDHRIQNIIARTTVSVDARVKDSTEHAAIVRVTLTNGAVVEECVTLALGKAQRWLTPQQLDDKFLDCSERVVGPSEARAILEALTIPDPDDDKKWDSHMRWNRNTLEPLRRQE